MFLDDEFSDKIENILSECREDNSEWVEENLEKTMDILMIGFVAGADHTRSQISGVDELVDEFINELEERFDE